MKIILAVMLLALPLLICPVAVEAEELGTALSVVSENMPAGGDVAGMGGVDAALGIRNFSTDNPGGIGAYSDFRTEAIVNYTDIGFEHGPGVRAQAISAIVNLDSAGVIQLQAVTTGSNYGRTALGLDAKISDTYYVSIAYGRQVGHDVFFEGDELYAGVGVTPISHSRVNLALEGSDIATSVSNGYSLTTGILYGLNDEFAIGTYYSYFGSSEKDFDMLADQGMDNISESHKARIGASCQIAPLTLIAADIQYLKINRDYERVQLFAGVEQGIIKDMLYVYGGWAADGPTAGLGFYLEHGGINLAYMNDPFGVTHDTLGRSRVIMAVGYLSF